MGRLRILILALPLVLVACASAASAQPDPPRQTQQVVRLLTNEGGDRTLVSSVTGGGEAPAKLTPPPTWTRTATPTVTPTASITPTVTRTPRATSTATVTPTATPTPRGGPDLSRMAAQFKKVERYRASLTGPADLTQEVVPDRYRVFVHGPRPLEFIVQDDGVYLRNGSFWRLLDDPPAELTARLDRGIPALELMARLKHQYALKGTVRARGGQCLDWEVVDALPKEPISICQGLADDLPYRIVLPGGAKVEFFDFEQDIRVPEPWPQTA